MAVFEIDSLDLIETLSFLVEHTAPLELINKLWIKNTKLVDALKSQPREISETLITQVLTFSNEYIDFKRQYIANTDNLKLLNYALDISTKFHDPCVIPAIFDRMHHLSQLRERITDFKRAIHKDEPEKVNSLWKGNPEIRRWYKRETLCIFENSLNRPSDEELIKLFRLMQNYPEKKLLFKYQELLQNPCLQTAISNNRNAGRVYHYLVKIAVSDETAL